MGKAKMSLNNLNRLLASIMLVLALTSLASAAQGFRPWAPYQRDEFGGGARRAEGVYGIIEGVHYTFAPVKNITIGDIGSTGGYRDTYTGSAILRQTNTIHTNNLGALSSLGTRAEVGNMVGHHGWSIAGYNMGSMSTSIDSPNASVVINDQGHMPAFSLEGTNLYFCYVLSSGKFAQVAPDPNSLYGGGSISVNGTPNYLWGWFMSRWTHPDTNDDILIGQLAPLPVNFEKATVTSKIEHWTVEAMYTYRCHPTRFGNLDIFGGVRYMEVDDSLNFYGEGLPWKGVTVVEDSEDGELEGSAFGVGTILGDSDWQFKADNHIIAPQIGARLSKTINRWTLSAEGKFMAGMNQQNMRSKGTFGSHYDKLNVNEEDIFPSDLLPDTVRDTGIYPWTPIGIQYGTHSFNHSAIRQAFSPGVEAKINANWQITKAVGFNFGVSGMWIDGIARGSKINDYTIFPNGQFFGLNPKATGANGFTDYALMYGVNFGLTINRY